MHNFTYPIFTVEESIDNFLFYFTTNDDVKYLIKFNKASYFFNIECEPCYSIYEISFYPENKFSNNNDNKVKNTIVEIIETFIIKNECPILYVCESIDKKHFVRAKLFRKWFKEYNLNQKYIHDFREIIFDDYELLVGIIGQSWDNNFYLYLNEIDMQNLN